MNCHKNKDYLMRPLIAISLERREDTRDGSFNKNHPFVAMEAMYFDAVYACGGLPIAMTDDIDAIDDYLSRVDGVLSPGGIFPASGKWYGSNDDTPGSARELFETAVIERTLQLDKPLLGICAGMQILAYNYGATFYADLHKETDTNLTHSGISLKEYAHDISINENSLLHKLTGTTKTQVNSHHNEAIKYLPQSELVVSATSADGIIEAIELPEHTFALGVQWHPEHFCDKDTADRKIMEGFIHACKGK